jgi:hypothetical protein
VVDESPRPDVEFMRLLIVGYDPGQLSDNRPAEGVLPRFFWVSPELEGTWPQSFEAPIPGDLVVLVVRDIDGDGRPSPADRRSDLNPLPKDTTEPIEFLIDRGFFDAPGGPGGPGRERRVPLSDGADRGPAAPPGERPSDENGQPGLVRRELPPSGLLLQPEGMERTPTTLRVISGTPGRKPVPGQKLMIIGFEKGGLSDGLPVAGTQPAYFWNQRHDASDWPLVFEDVPLPSGLDLMIVLDADGDGMPSPADLAAAPLDAFDPPPAGRPLEILLDRRFAPQERPEGPDGREGDEDDDEDDDEGLGEDDGWLPDSEESAARGTLRLVEIDSRPRVPFLRNGVLMIVGYAPGDVAGANPADGAVPKFFWASEDLQLTWPLQLEVPLPTGGMTMFVVLDLDSDRRPSPGDLSSERFVGFEPGAPGDRLLVLLEKAFGLAGPSDVPGTDRDDDE